MHLLATLLLLAAPASAQEGDPPAADAAEQDAPAEAPDAGADTDTADAELSLGDRADAAFGKWVVGPLASVMFFDLYRGDETLDVSEEHIGTIIDGRQIVGIEGEHYVLAPVLQLELPQAFPMYPELTRQDQSPAAWGYLSKEADHVPYTLLVVEESTVTLEQAGELVPLSEFDGALKAEPELADTDQHFVSTALAPFPLVLAQALPTGEDTSGPTDPEASAQPDPDTSLRVLPLELPAPDHRPELSVGGSILTLSGPAKVLSIDGDKVTAQIGEPAVETEPLANPRAITLPVVVVWLVLGAVFFTLRMNFINLRGMGHAIRVTKGDYDNEEDEGEISHFQALSSALSATVGLGNIAGVAVAVAAGGPGAIFWMIVAGFLGMSSKFAECTLGQMYRVTDANGNVSGGPMRYLSAGLKEKGMGGLGKVLAVMFALMCIGGSFGGGNMFQSNQSYQAVADVVPVLAPKAEGEVRFERTRAEVDVVVPKDTVLTVGEQSYLTLAEATLPAGELTSPAIKVRAGTATEAANLADGTELSLSVVGVSSATAVGSIDGGAAPRSWLYGLILSFVVGLVIIGGIKSIGKVAGIIVPVMTGVYVLAAIWILIANADHIGTAFGTIVGSAFTMKAGFGGLLGTLIQGFRRAAFSNEAGVGSASIAHSAASTDEPIREGIVALLEPFIDTIIVCTMTGLVVVITGVYDDNVGDGVLMTSAAFSSVLDWFPLILSLAVVLFAFSTMISWSYYGERSWTFLFGARSSLIYKVLFLFFAFLGAVIKLQSVLDFSDLMILGMAFPNILGVALLSGKVRAALDDYWGRLKSGEMKPVN